MHQYGAPAAGAERRLDSFAATASDSAILRYLDVALVVELMRELGLAEERARRLPREDNEVTPERVVLALGGLCTS